MPIKGTKHTDSNASAMRELEEGNSARVNRRQSNPGNGTGRPVDLTSVSDRQDKDGGIQHRIKSDGRGNPV
jgi:hypothetical protein